MFLNGLMFLLVFFAKGGGVQVEISRWKLAGGNFKMKASMTINSNTICLCVLDLCLIHYRYTESYTNITKPYTNIYKHVQPYTTI